LGRSFQWELRSRCQKSKGTEFPCVPAEIKPYTICQFTIVHGAVLPYINPVCPSVCYVRALRLNRLMFSENSITTN